jgi:predicted dehydrogenase
MNFDTIKLAIIGGGRWGFNHIKTAYSLLNKEQIIVVDTSDHVVKKLSENKINVKYTADLNDVLDDPAINAVIIATPAETHYSIAKEFLQKGKNVLVEKPITLHTEEAEELVSIAGSNSLKLMVGHVLLFHPAIKKIKEEILNGKIGKLQYIYSNRLNLGAVRTEENILWSFAPHDISVIQYLVGSNPENIIARGSQFLQTGIEDTTLTYLTYPHNINAHIFVSWLHPFKEQRLVVIGSDGMFVLDDAVKEDKLKFYAKGFKKVNGKIEKFDSDHESVQISDAQPLAEEQKHFFECIENNKEPLTNGRHAVEVLKILEEATRSLQEENNLKLASK